jgi:indolepyruvate ferredoxin oxidoreductase beta subunit
MLARLTAQRWSIPATAKAMELGGSIFANIIMIGALAATGDLSLSREGFQAELLRALGPAKVATNLEAYDLGAAMVGG